MAVRDVSERHLAEQDQFVEPGDRRWGWHIGEPVLTRETLERDALSAFIEKPFSGAELQRKMRELLDTSSGS